MRSAVRLIAWLKRKFWKLKILAKFQRHALTPRIGLHSSVVARRAKGTDATGSMKILSAKSFLIPWSQFPPQSYGFAKINPPYQQSGAASSSRPKDALLKNEVSRNVRKIQSSRCAFWTFPYPNRLQTHKYNSMRGENGEEIFESYAENKTPAAHRIFWHYGPKREQITVIAIVPHPQSSSLNPCGLFLALGENVVQKSKRI